MPTGPGKAGANVGEGPQGGKRMAQSLKRGMRVIYAYAGGKVVPGKVLRSYSPDMPDWWLLRLTDPVDGTSIDGGCHRDQITVIDNRPSHQ